MVGPILPPFLIPCELFGLSKGNESGEVPLAEL